MKKTLFFTILVIIAMFAMITNVQAVEVATSSDLGKYLEETDETIVTLTDSMTLTETITISNGKTKTLDLNGKTLTLGSYSIDIKSGTLTVKNGKIEADVDALRVLSTGSAILNIEEDAEVTAGDCAVIIKCPGAVLNTAGKLTSTGGGYAAIQGNGLDGNGGIKVNITGGTITSNAEGVYFPNTTELNIRGGTITGTTAVYHKSGKLNISGGTLKATGVAAEYVHNSNGCNATGDALVVEASNYPGGVPEVSITGGTFISENNKAIGYYKQTENTKLENEKFVTGGTFSSDVSGYVDGESKLVEVDGSYIFQTQLSKPTNLKWDKTTAKWEEVPNAKSYMVILYKGDEVVDVLSIEDTNIDLAKYLTDKTAKYNFAVCAEGDGKLYTDSQIVASDVYEFSTEEDKKEEPTEEPKVEADKKEEKDETPKTGSVDVVLFASVIVAVISVAGIVTVKKYTR